MMDEDNNIFIQKIIQDVNETLKLKPLYIANTTNTEKHLQKEIDKLFGEDIFKVKRDGKYTFQITLTEKGLEEYEKILSNI